MANTFELIASSTVGSGGASSIDFTSIPSTYTDLVVKCSLRDGISGSAQTALLVYFNTDNGTSSYDYKTLRGSGSAASSFGGSGYAGCYAGQYDGNTATSSTFSSTEIYIPNYAGSQKKSLSIDSVQENNATAAFAELIAGLWSAAGGTAAINAVHVVPQVGNFVQYSTAYLYGVKNA